ncbi:MAG: inorganic phosphate transporter [Candidatus Omnitrophica bacterium]|nr:inorganic phosphate transporter [Candidatus Omnitrophota bacterium]
MIWTIFIILSMVLVAYANGANDNFKGVATLFGSGTTDYRKALWWATITTLAGSITAFFFASSLVKTFSGKGLIPDTLIASPDFLVAVALGASLTVLIAALTGIPISTTHGLIGALVGAGLVAAGASHLGFHTLGKSFFMPLLVSPVIAVIATVVIYPLFRFARHQLGVTRQTCVCIGEKVIPVPSLACCGGQALSVAQLKSLDIMIDEQSACQAKAVEYYQGNLFGINAQQFLDALHFLSAGAVSFARGLNDTPKIVALCVTAKVLGLQSGIMLVAVVIAIGGLLNARRIAETMSNRITYMNHGQGFSANLITAILVIFASKWGVPVSTTHVSCGSLFGIGLSNGKANWKVITGILSAWVLTLPIAAAVAGAAYFVLHHIL